MSAGKRRGSRLRIVENSSDSDDDGTSLDSNENISSNQRCSRAVLQTLSPEKPAKLKKQARHDNSDDEANVVKQKRTQTKGTTTKQSAKKMLSAASQVKADRRIICHNDSISNLSKDEVVDMKPDPALLEMKQEDVKPDVKTMTAIIRHTSNNSDDTSDTSIDDLEDVGQKVSKVAKKKKSKMSEEGKKRATATPGDEKSGTIRRLEKIARACGVLPVGSNYRRTFEDCKTMKQREIRLRQLLREAGMIGIPSMKAAEKLKLKKEAEELNMANIIVSEGRSRRSVHTLYCKSLPPPTSPVRELSSSLTPPRHHFAKLRGIIDSDSSSNDSD
jgi:hypothetical protein